MQLFNKAKHIFLSLILLLCFNSLAHGFHIVGGEMYYECIGNNQYVFHMNVYKDCFARIRNPNDSIAPFDNPANITIFRNSNILSYVVTIPVTDSIVIPPNIPLDCIVNPPEVCVEETEYTFGPVTLPFDPGGYTVTYQRCCRNNTITNINDPASAGATYSIDLTAEAMAQCNNSPEYNVFPPIIICAGQPIDFTHSATDVDGDSLAYSFCSPFLGGSTSTVAPNPDLPPPYTEVPFLSGFSAAFPMGGNPIVTIDPISGYIRGNPDRVGQYVVAVCVSDFRNGTLLSTVRRDFQFNVTPCEKKVFADVRKDAVTGDNDFVIKSCGELTVDFINQSFDEAFITDYNWSIDRGSLGTFTSNDKDVTVEFPEVGTYLGQMILNLGGDICTDTANIIVEIFPEVIADFSYTHDSCVLTPILFNDLSIVSTNNITNWEWNMGDATSYNTKNISHIYQEANSYPVTLFVEDNNGCSDDTTRIVPWFPAPEISVAFEDSGCAPHEVFFDFDNTLGPTNGYTWTWDFDGGVPLSDPPFQNNPTVLYSNSGTYNAKVQIVSPLNCISVDSFDLTIFEPPIAAINVEQDTCSVGEVLFFDNSTVGDGLITTRNWNFRDSEIISTQTNPSILFPNSGTYPFEYTITDANGCRDVINSEILYFPIPEIEINVLPTRGCDSILVSFTNEIFPNIGYNILWDFGDGTTSEVSDPQHLYNQVGRFLPTFTINSSISGCNAIEDLPQISVFRSPRVNFNYAGDSCNIPATYSFNTNIIPGDSPIFSYLWDFDNGLSSENQSPSSSYNLPGFYQPKLTITDGNGCSDSSTSALQYFPSPNIDINVLPTQGCDSVLVSFNNQTFPNVEYDFLWNFGDGTISNDFETQHLYEQVGTFLPTFTISSPITGCNSIEELPQIKVFKSPEINFTYLGDSCNLPATYFFNSNIIPGDSPIFNYLWDFDNGQSSIIPSPSSVYDTPGFYLPKLTITDENSCFDEFENPLAFFPLPILSMAIDSESGCVPLNVQFNLEPDLGNEGYLYQWNFGDNANSFLKEPIHSYKIPGSYNPNVSITSISGCFTTVNSSSTINALENPIADFTFSPEKGSNFDPEISFFDNSYAAVRWFWDFGDGNQSVISNPVHEYSPLDTGFNFVQLAVRHSNGCVDTIGKYVEIVPLITYFMPNAFTPDENGLNDGYRGNGAFLNFIQNYRMTIWNRWGELIFETEDPFEFWNGRKNNTGNMSQNGVYVAIVEFEGPRGKKYFFKEFATLIR